MNFLFFRADDTILFNRNDAESARWCVQEMTLNALFPYDSQKTIERGMRIGFPDETGVFQFFEIRKVRTMEPDHFQEVTAEHIAISELTDWHVGNFDALNRTARDVVAQIINGSQWQIGTVSVGDLTEQERVRQEITALALNGNVDLTKRPIIYKTQMQRAGYTGFSDSYTTLYPSIVTWTQTETVNDVETTATLATILVTPIRADGTVFSQQRLDEYMETVYTTAGNVSGLIDADTDGMIIHYLSGDQTATMGSISTDAEALANEWCTTIFDEQSSAEFGMGSAWQDICTVRDSWNVTIKPRVTYDATGITGRYLDIAPNQPVWRGIRLSINKNADDVGVTYDDTDLVTAMYGYGAGVETDGAEESTPLTFEGITWTQTAEHPAKPSGQAYIEDPNATALYGRNGQARFGFYQNGDIKSAEVLLEKTWAALKNQKEPTVTIDMLVHDLYRLGYADQPLRLGDFAIVDIEPIGVQLRRTIIGLEVDLIDPTATRATIGTYIPNIVYINRDIAKSTGGGGGSGRSKDSQTEAEYKRSEFETDINANNYQISLRAYQNDLDTTNDQLRQAEITIAADGVRITAAEGNITNHDTRISTNQAAITVNSDKIGLVVETVNGANVIKAADIGIAINKKGSNAYINADHISFNAANSITLGGMVQVTGTTFQIEGGVTGDGTLTCYTIEGYNVEAEGEVSAKTLTATASAWLENVTIDEEEYAAKTVTIAGATVANLKVLGTGTGTALAIPDAIASFQTPTSSEGQILIPYTKVGGTTGTINFNIADTAYFQNAVSAAVSSVNVDSITAPAISANTVSSSTAITATASARSGSVSATDTGTASLVLERGTYVISGSTLNCVSASVGGETVARIGIPSVTMGTMTATDIGDIDTNHVVGTVYVSASAGATNTATDSYDLVLTTGRWNSDNEIAANIRVGSDSGTLIARKWITAPSVSISTSKGGSSRISQNQCTVTLNISAGGTSTSRTLNITIGSSSVDWSISI